MSASPPAVNVTIQDGGLGLAPVSTDGSSFKIGVSSLGTPGQVYNIADPDLIRSTLGVGPLVECGVYHAKKSGGKPQYFIPVTASVAGVSGSITKSNAGGPTIVENGAPLDEYAVIVSIVKTGVLGAGSFTYSLDGGDSTSAVYALPSAGLFTIPNSGMVVTFPAAVATSAITHGGGGPTITRAGTPLTLDAVQIKITTGGTLGTAAFTVALNGGTPSAPITTTGGSFDYLVPGTGITATFPAGTYVLNDTYDWTVTGIPYTSGDTYTWSTTAPAYSTGDLGVALDAMNASVFAARGVHVIGRAATASACAAVAAIVDSALVTAQGNFKYMWGLVESPSEALATDSQLIAAFNSFSSLRTSVAGGTEQLFSDVDTGRDYRRSVAWPYAARVAAIPISQDPGWVGAPQGAVVGINVGSVQTPPGNFGLWRNESATPGLDAARFVTLRIFSGRPGIYITKGRTMAPPGSDFSLIQYRQVMDKAAELAYQEALPFLNATIPTDPTTGFIDPTTATAIEKLINAAMTDQLVTPGHAVRTEVQVRRDNNILSSGVLFVKILIQPNAYASQIELTLTFTNPALLLAA